MLYNWIMSTNEQITAEDKVRAERDEPPLSGPKSWLQNRMTPALVKAWKQALETGSSTVVPAFRFKALLRKDAGPARIEIDGLTMPVDKLSLHDVAKVYRRCHDLAASLEPVLAAKAAEAAA